MESKKLENRYFVNQEELHLYELPQIFLACSNWFNEGTKNIIATFEISVRDMPKNRNFLLFGGLDEIIRGILSWKYTEEDIKYLQNAGLISQNFVEYLRNFRFSGTIHALKEGTVFFPGEPVIRVTAPIIEANLITMFLLNSVTGNTMFLSKVIRSVIVARPKMCIGVAGTRAQSFESALKCARASYIAGAQGINSIPAIAKKLGLPPAPSLTVAYHAVIKSFPTELEAMRKVARFSKGMVSLMVDTYDFNQGMKNAITVAKELKERGLTLYGVMLDSGNLYENCIKAREMLDSEGLHEVKITIASNLDEYKILKLNEKKIPADAFLIATEIVSLVDSPKLETVYKLVELRKNNEVIFCAKFSPKKESYPAKKQIFRTYKDGIIKKDIIGKEEEELGEPLLIGIIKKGGLVYNLPKLNEIKDYVDSQISKLPKNLLEIKNAYKFDVGISSKLHNLFLKIKEKSMEGT